MCARPISSSCALLRVRTCEPTHRKRLAAGVLTILWAIGRYTLMLMKFLFKETNWIYLKKEPPSCAKCFMVHKH